MAKDKKKKNVKEISISVDGDKLLKVSKKSLEICSMICVFITISILLLKIKNVLQGHSKTTLPVVIVLFHSMLVGLLATYMQQKYMEMNLKDTIWYFVTYACILFVLISSVFQKFDSQAVYTARCWKGDKFRDGIKRSRFVHMIGLPGVLTLGDFINIYHFHLCHSV